MNQREVIQADAIEWLSNQPIQAGASFIASLPDYSEFPGLTLDQWKTWFTETARLVLSKTPDDGVTLFFQTDIKFEGTWVDKGYLCQKAADQLGIPLLWHKVFCRFQADHTSFGRPSYSHLLCFSKNVRADLSKSTPDVVTELGEQAWVRGMGIYACRVACEMILKQTSTRRVINPFCGHGSVLAMANHLGMDAIGIEKSPKRAEKSRTLQVIERRDSNQDQTWSN